LPFAIEDVMKANALVLGCIVAFVCAAPAAWSAEAERPRTVAVSGQGEVQAEPDRALVTLGAEARRPKMEEARAEVTRTIDAILKLTRDMNIDQKLVRATRINVQPDYNWNQNTRERKLIGYYVSRQVEIEMRDLERLGSLMERALNLGVNQIGEPRLDSSKRRDLEREALAKAVADARLNAEAVAKAAGARLGPPRTISASSGFVAPPMPMARRTMSMEANVADAAQTYQSGQMTFNGTVQVEYDLVPTTP
jgi:uncharacterized protein YggE